MADLDLIVALLCIIDFSLQPENSRFFFIIIVLEKLEYSLFYFVFVLTLLEEILNILLDSIFHYRILG